MATTTSEKEANPHNRAMNAEPDASAKLVMRWMLIGLAIAVVVSIGYRARYGWNMDNQPKIEPIPSHRL